MNNKNLIFLTVIHNALKLIIVITLFGLIYYQQPC